jgi:hypothetical protein
MRVLVFGEGPNLDVADARDLISGDEPMRGQLREPGLYVQVVGRKQFDLDLLRLVDEPPLSIRERPEPGKEQARPRATFQEFGVREESVFQGSSAGHQWPPISGPLARLDACVTFSAFIVFLLQKPRRVAPRRGFALCALGPIPVRALSSFPVKVDGLRSLSGWSLALLRGRTEEPGPRRVPGSALSQGDGLRRGLRGEVAHRIASFRVGAWIGIVRL